MTSKVEINFENEAAAKHFARWLCGQGEQDYWIWMEEREFEESGNITAKSFDYDYENNVINTRCGRISKAT